MIAPVDVTSVRIETERLIIRPWRESDAEDFYEYLLQQIQTGK